MQLPRVAMWSGGVDYLRLTCKKGQNDGDWVDLCKRLGRGVLASSDGLAPEWQAWGWMGYRGSSAPHVACGASEQGTILQVSGWPADDASWLKVPWDNCTRIDVQVTVWFEHDQAHLARRIGDAFASAPSQGRGRKPRVTYIDGYGHGDTTYIGRRSSGRFVRIYDKWRETGLDEEYRHAWRFEVEAHDEVAREIWEGAKWARERHKWAASIVLGEAQRAGWVAPDLGLAPVRVGGRKETDPDATDRRLAWLRRSVAPAVEKLLTGGVDRRRLLDLLGLEEE